MPFDMNNAPNRKSSNGPSSGSASQSRTPRPEPAYKEPQNEYGNEYDYQRQNERHTDPYASSRDFQSHSSTAGFQNIPERRDDNRRSESTSIEPHRSYDDYDNLDESYDTNALQAYDISSESTSLETRRAYDDYMLSTPVQQPHRKETVRRPAVRRAPIHIDIPWGLLLTIAALVGVFVFVYSYRYEISAFLYQVVQWAIILIVILSILKSLFSRH